MDNAKRRADEAAFILSSQVFQETFSALETTIISEWRRCTDTAQREEYWRRLRLLGQLKTELEGRINTYKITTKRSANNG